MKIKETIINRFDDCQIDGTIDVVVKENNVDVYIKNETGSLYWFFIYLDKERCEILINGKFDYYELQYLAVFTEFCRDLILNKKYKQLSLDLGV